MKRTGPIRVLIVDDSPAVRTTLSRVLSECGDMSVVGEARDPYEARELILAHRPDVIVLDLRMPRMDGLTFLRKLMIHYPVAVIVCSDGSPRDEQDALAAVSMGAIDVITKPQGCDRAALRRFGAELADLVRAAAISRPVPPPLPPVAAAPPSFAAAGLDPEEYLIVLGASTGGTEAIRVLLRTLPADFPPLVIVQHMPAGFTASFAHHLDQAGKLRVSEARDGDSLQPGKAFLARGDRQMTVVPSGSKLRVRCGGTEPVNRHCPSVDVLFDSAARITSRKLVGILLTGMGADGAQGLLHLHLAGAVTIAQDQRSCVVYGMPKVAAELGAVDLQCAPHETYRQMIRLLRSPSCARRPASIHSR